MRGLTYLFAALIGTITALASADFSPETVSKQPCESKLMTYEEKVALLNKRTKERLKILDTFIEKIKSDKVVEEVVRNKLYYKILKPGNGPVITFSETPILIYTARTIEEGDEELFSCSEPKAFNLADTIPGLRNGVIGMRLGEQRELYIHPDLAYGKHGGTLPPNTLLIFDVELIGIEGTLSY